MAANNHNLIHYLFTAFYSLFKALISSLVWLLVGLVGLLVLKARRTPWDILLGLPLLLTGSGFVVNNFWSAFLAIFYLPYNRGVCVLCKKERFKDHAKIKEILGI